MPEIVQKVKKKKPEEKQLKTAKKAKGSASKLMTLLLYASVCWCAHMYYVCKEVGGGRWGMPRLELSLLPSITLKVK